MSKLGNFYVKWQHKTNSTACVVKKNDDVLAIGLAIKHPKDKPDLRVARRISFQRAMRELSQNPKFPKIEIGMVWNDYMEKVRQPS